MIPHYNFNLFMVEIDGRAGMQKLSNIKIILILDSFFVNGLIHQQKHKHHVSFKFISEIQN